MPNSAIIVGSIAARDGQLQLSGIIALSPGGDPSFEQPWQAVAAFGATAAQINNVIQAAAVAAAGAAGFIVGPSDSKTIFGGAS